MIEEPPSRLEGKLEPEAKPCRTPKDAALTSIAVSLKRIADRLDENTSYTYNEPAFWMRGDMA